MSLKTAAATIVRRKDFTADLFVLWLEPDIAFTFTPGQYATVGVSGIERPYSIVSAPYEPLIELFIEHVHAGEGGQLTPILHRGRVGDAVTMRPTAKGLFTLRDGVTHHVMVATVTGIAPYVSMIRQSLYDQARGDPSADGRRFYVMHGASYQDEFVYDRELRGLSEQYPGRIQYVPSVSRPSEARNLGWGGAVGRVNSILDDHLAQWIPPKEDTVIYLCGNPGMIEDSKARLTREGWLVAHEQFWSR